MNDLTNPNSAVHMLCGRAYLEAALTRWTLGDRVYANFLKRLHAPPPEIWEIRVTEPVVHARLFGRFAEPDTLILTKFHTRGMLGDAGSQDWANAMNGCAASWDALFPETAPFSGNHVQQYVTENCDAYHIA